MISPSAGLRWSGQPICWDAAVTSGMWANLIAASKDMNATGIAVSTRPDHRMTVESEAGKAGLSSVASIDSSPGSGALESAHVETTSEGPRDRHRPDPPRKPGQSLGIALGGGQECHRTAYRAGEVDVVGEQPELPGRAGHPSHHHRHDGVADRSPDGAGRLVGVH